MSKAFRLSEAATARVTTPRRSRIASPIAAILAGGVVLTQLQGCFPVMVAGVVVGTIAATDRRTVGTQADDGTISVKVEGRIKERLGGSARVGAMTYNRKVLLIGEVPTQAAKDDAGRIAAGVENVVGLVNELEVGPPSSLSSRSNDAFISTKVKASLVDARDVFANAYRVTTNQGNVYLMGRVTQREGDRAAQIARGVSGVNKVVKIFDYISEDELSRMKTVPSK